MYCLWISGKQVYNLKQLKENFDLDSVEIYYSGGGLVRWLRLCGEDETADKVEKIDTSSDLSERLAEIFGQPKPEKKALTDKAFFDYIPKSGGGFDTSFSANNVQVGGGSFEIGITSDSFNYKSSLPLSNETTSFKGLLPISAGSSQAVLSSFSPKSSSFFLNYTSFLTTSFNLGLSSFRSSSFHEYEYEFETGGSFNTASGSFFLGSFGVYNGSFAVTSFRNTSFNIEKSSSGTAVFVENGKDCPDYESSGNETDTEEPSPNEKILQNIIACPLNRFGYGLHLI